MARALNGDEVDHLAGLSYPNVKIGGPRGSGHGARLLREWAERANIQRQSSRVFHRADTVVVDQEAEWRSPDAGEDTGSQTVSSVFVVREGRVARVMRYDGPAGALDVANVDGSHELGVV